MIFVSAGHFPDRPGAKYGDFDEHTEAVKWRDLILSMLGHDGRCVPSGTLREKVQFINGKSIPQDVAIEIHFNAAKKNGEYVGRGCETLYMPDSVAGKGLAVVCQAALSKHFHPDRGVKEGYYRMDPANGPDFFLVRTNVPAVILEPDFIHRKAKIVERREVCCAELAKLLIENYGHHNL